MPASAARARDLHIGNGGAGAESMAVFDLDLAEAAAETDHHALDAAVAHQQVRTEADDGDGNVRRASRRK